MNKVYLYDGSFLSLLNLIITIIEIKELPSNIKSESEYVPNLLDEVINLKLDDNNNKVKRISPILMKTMYYVYLSNDEYKELVIYYFYKNSLKYRDAIYYHRHLRCVNKAIKLAKMVSGEAHKLKGFLRFQETKNKFFYAKVSPTNNVIEILANHFKKRLANENWLIHDTKREIYAIYDTKKVIYLMKDEVLGLNINLTDSEEQYEDLWKTFFKTIAIRERKNLRCQMNFMPKKYWNNMIEMEEYYETSNN